MHATRGTTLHTNPHMHHVALVTAQAASRRNKSSASRGCCYCGAAVPCRAFHVLSYAGLMMDPSPHTPMLQHVAQKRTLAHQLRIACCAVLPPGDDDGPFAGGSDGEDDDEEDDDGADDDSLPSSDQDGEEEGALEGMMLGDSGDGSDGEGEDEDGEEGEDGDEGDEERRGSGSKAGASGGFMQGAKGASFAKAFSKLVEGKAKKGDADAPILAVRGLGDNGIVVVYE